MLIGAIPYCDAVGVVRGVWVNPSGGAILKTLWGRYCECGSVLRFYYKVGPVLCEVQRLCNVGLCKGNLRAM